MTDLREILASLEAKSQRPVKGYVLLTAARRAVREAALCVLSVGTWHCASCRKYARNCILAALPEEE
jgi:hypothetical protein